MTLFVCHSILVLLSHYLVLTVFLVACKMASEAEVTFERRHCGEHHPLELNQACLRVEATDPVILEAQSEECVGCPMWTVYEGRPAAPPANDGVPVNTSWATSLKLTNAGRSGSCKITFHFGEFGEYGIRMGEGEGEECEMDVLTEPVHSLAFVLYVFLALFVLRALWLVARCAFRTRWARARWMYYRFGVSLDLQEDLADDASLVAATQEQEQLQQQSNPPGRSQDDAGDSSEAADDALVAPAPRPRARVKSVDVLRGISIAVMIFVNYGGGDYWFFRHSPWNGLTVADLVFPWFLWVMGVSLVLSVNAQLRRGATRTALFLSVVRRSAALVFLGLFLNSGRHSDFRSLRLPGVLQRFGIVYFIVASVEVYFMSREHPSPLRGAVGRAAQDLVQNPWQLAVAACLAALHTCLTFLLPVPGCPTGYLGPGGLHDGARHGPCTGGAAGHVDRTLFGDAHLYRHPTSAKVYDSSVPYDPEGLLGCLTSAVLVLLGCHAAKIMLVYQSCSQRVVRWTCWAVFLGLVAGALCGFSKEDGVIPVNKNLWSLSFILALGSMAFFLIAILYVKADFVLMCWLEKMKCSFVLLSFIQVCNSGRVSFVVRRPIHLRRHEPHCPVPRTRALPRVLPLRVETLQPDASGAGRHEPVGDRPVAYAGL